MKKQGATRATDKSKPINSMSELAALVDRDKGTVSRWTKRDEWPFPRRAPWARAMVPKILNWVADTLEQGKQTDSEGATKSSESGETTKDLREQKLRQEIRKLRAQADQAETALAKERADLHDANECEEEAVRRAALYRNGIQNIPAQIVSAALSHGIPHEAAPQFQKQVEELVNGCLRYTSTTADAQSAAGDDSGVSSVTSEGTVDPIAVG